MVRIKALLIEEIIMVLFMIYSGVLMSDYINTGNEILWSMLIFGIMIAFGKSIEAIVDHTICKSKTNNNLYTKLIRPIVCILFSSLVFFVLFCFYFQILPNRVLTFIYAVISISFAAMHLAISRIIDKVLGLYNKQTFISRP